MCYFYEIIYDVKSRNCQTVFGCELSDVLLSKRYTKFIEVCQLTIAIVKIFFLCVCVLSILLSLYCVFTLRRMHEMQTIVTGVRGVCLSVCMSVMRLNWASQCRGHSVEPLPYHFRLLFLYL